MILSYRTEESFYRLILIQIVLLLVYASCMENEEAMANDYPSFQRPIGGKMYFAIAAASSGQLYSRAFNKTLMNITQLYMASNKMRYNISLETLIIELPENGSFSAMLLETVCAKFEGKHVMAVLIVGDSQAAFMVSVTAKHAGIPVLWARGHNGFLPGIRSLESSPLEIQLAPTSRELVAALRGLLMQAHWHSFTLMADSHSAAALQRQDLWTVLNAQPLHPTLVALTSPIKPQTLFRKLADISRSTRGVVILLCSRATAVRVLEDARRLNMMDGHFVWLWIDTAATITIKNNTNEDKDPDRDKNKPIHIREDDRYKRSSPSSDLSDMNVNYLLRNDQFLLFNRNDFGVESSKVNNIAKTSRGYRNFSLERSGDLPSGLLCLKPLPVKVDRHLVKGAVRLLVTTLRLVLDWSSDRMLHGIGKRQLTTSCWKPLGNKESEFSNHFARED